MPSPIAHLVAAYAVYELARQQEPEPGLHVPGPVPALLLVTAAFSLLPDADSIAGVVTGDFGRYHNNATHSLMVAPVVALGFAAFMHARKRRGFLFWFAIALICYAMHVIMDSATQSRGVMVAWPVSDQRYLLPFAIFYGLRWTDGVFSLRHLWTVFTELLFAASVFGLLQYWPRRTRAQA